MNKNNNIRYLSYALFGLLGLLFVPFWSSLVVAGIFAFALHPLVVKLRAKTHRAPGKIIIGIVVLTTLSIVTPIILGTISISSQIVELAQSKDLKSNNITQMVKAKITQVSEQLGLPKNTISNGLYEKVSNELGQGSLKYASNMISSLPDIVVSLLIFTLALYLLLSYHSYLHKKIISMNLLPKNDLDELVGVMQTSCIQCLLSLIIIGAIQASVVVIGAAIAGFDQLLLIFLITLICSFVPIIGAAPIAFGLGLWKLMDGYPGMGFFLIFISVIAGTIDNVLKPLMVKKGIELDASITLISIIGAIVLFGIPGLFIGPVVSSAAAYYFSKIEHKDI